MTPALKPSLTTTTSLDLAPDVVERLALDIEAYARLGHEIKKLEAERAALSADISDTFIEHDAFHALETGVTVPTGLGIVPLKLVEGETVTLDEMALMRRCAVTPADLDACRTHKPKKAYVSVSIPRKGRS